MNGIEKFDPNEYRDNLADFLKSVPDHTERKEVLNTIEGTATYKAAEEINNSARGERIEESKRKIEEIRIKDNKELFDRYVNECLRSTEALEKFFEEVASFKEGDGSQRANNVDVHGNFVGGLFVFGRSLERMLNFFHFTLGEGFPEVEKILDEMAPVLRNLEYIPTGQSVNSGDPYVGYQKWPQSKLQDPDKLLKYFRGWVDETALIIPKVNEKTEKYFQSNLHFQEDFRKNRVLGSYKKYFYS